MRQVGIEEARKTLGEIANWLHYGDDGESVTLMRNGSPVVEMFGRATAKHERVYVEYGNAELARLTLAGDEHAQTELFTRMPYLAGFYGAAEHLQRQHIDAFWEARGGFDPWSTDAPQDDAPGHAELMAAYNKSVRRMAGQIVGEES